MTEWVYSRAEFDPGEEWPDGSRPYDTLRAFAPWVELATSLMDGEGAWTGYLWPGTLMEQPEFDMQVLTIIRGRWNEMRTEEMRRGAKK